LLLFLYNPAGIFFNVVYTESLFCLLSFKAVKYLLQREKTTQSILLMSCSVAIRSNGMFLAPVIGLELLQRFFANLRSKISSSLGAFIQGISIIVILVVPFIAHNFYTYHNICQSANHSSSMCEGGLLSFYGAVQDRYWNVGFLRYFNMGNIVFIIIGTPAVIAGALCLLQYEKGFDLRQKGLYLSFVILFAITALFTNIQSSTRFFCGHAFFYFAMAKLAQSWRIVRLWAIFYWLTGIFMYVVNFPWT
jgi:Gpi18-like mannosyltransferase